MLLYNFFVLIVPYTFFFQLEDYLDAQAKAKKQHLNIWEYGDITEDDAKEFGLGNCKYLSYKLNNRSSVNIFQQRSPLNDQ